MGLFPLIVKATLPVGADPGCPATMAMNVTGWFAREGFVDVVMVVCVAKRFTLSVNIGEALARLFQSPE